MSEENRPSIPQQKQPELSQEIPPIFPLDQSKHRWPSEPSQEAPPISPLDQNKHRWPSEGPVSTPPSSIKKTGQ